MHFFGREDILRNLDDLWGKGISSFVTCRGRRRIGKSTLIERFAELSGARFIKIEGAKPSPGMSDERERKAFADQLRVQAGTEKARPENWLDAMIRLSSVINDNEKTVVLLDEVSWLAHYDRTFSATLKIAWDNYLKKHDRMIFFVCGSVSTWIKDEFIDNKAFYGRRSLDLIVPELPLCECVKFWKGKAANLPTREIFDILAVTGGVPRYLEEINPSLTASENLRRMCFIPKAPLREDFDAMFEDVIMRQPTFTGKVRRTLSGGSRTVTEIAAEIGVDKGGNVSSALEQLVESGMVSSDGGKNPQTGAEIRERRYRLKDNYVRFYLRYIEPIKDSIDGGTFVFKGTEYLSGWNQVMGLAFENMVVNHVRDLLKPLHLENAQILSAAPYCRKGSAERGVKGCQIDLLVQMKSSVCIVEIKREKRIGVEVVREMQDKVAAFPRKRGTTLRTALVYDGELDPVVEAEGYFDAIVPFRSLLQIGIIGTGAKTMFDKHNGYET